MKNASPLRVLIADDSVLYRSQVKLALSEIANVTIVGVASNGRIACDFLEQSKIDLLILDLEMPEMDGLQTLHEMRRRGITSTKVILFSSFTKRGIEITLEALQLGASDFVVKVESRLAEAEGGPTKPSDLVKALLEPKIRALFSDRLVTDLDENPIVARTALSDIESHGLQSRGTLNWDLFNPSVVVIGSSTGGPTALESIFSKLNGPLRCPVLIAQHMPKLFTATLAERLQRISGIPAREAINGEPLNKNQIYVAPGEYHMVVKGTSTEARLSLNQDPQEHFVRPAVDPLFRSAANIFAQRCLGIVLTGMGSDGTLGAEEIKRRGGAVVIQNKESCVVFGMPSGIFASGLYDRMGTPLEIAEMLSEKIGSEKRGLNVS